MASKTAPAPASDRPRVLAPEKVSPEGLALFKDKFEVDSKLGLSPEELIALIPQYAALIVRSETKVTEEVLAAGTNLKVVARAGVGVDNINVDAATKQGVIVVNSPAGNIAAAAEHTIALLLATARNVGRADTTLKDGKWERGKLVGIEVGGKTLGIIGLGKVGMKVARMAKGLGMNVVALDPYASPDIAKGAGVDLVDKLEALLPIVDFLTIHTPLLATTLNLLGEEQFKSMRKTARVLNVARGGVYNEEALVKALDEGWIAGAGIDVYTSEPPAPDSSASKLASHPKVVATPHLGASTVEAQENVSLDVCTQVVTILGGGLPTAAVNAPLILPEEYRTLQPFVKLVERLGSLYTQHFISSGKGGSGLLGGRSFELVYRGELAGISNTRPLFAALVKGLVSSISDSGGRDVNIVNATLIAKEKGIAISETRTTSVGGKEAAAYSSLVTLKAVQQPAKEEGEAGGISDGGLKQEVIEGYVSGNVAYISRLGRFEANFTPEGTLLVLHNHDAPGKIGNVGTVLGKAGVNIKFMHVASLRVTATDGANGDEALMILGVNGDVTKEVVEDLGKAEGILDVKLVSL